MTTLVVASTDHSHSADAVIGWNLLTVASADHSHSADAVATTRGFYDIADESIAISELVQTVFAFAPAEIIYADPRVPFGVTPTMPQTITCTDAFGAFWTWLIGEKVSSDVGTDPTLSLAITLAQALSVSDGYASKLDLTIEEGLDATTAISEQIVRVAFVTEALSALLNTTAQVDLKALAIESVTAEDAFVWVARVLHQDGLNVSADMSFKAALTIAEIIRAEIDPNQKATLALQASESPLVQAAILWVAKLAHAEALTVADLTTADYAKVLRVVEAIHAVGEILPALWVAFKANEHLTVEDLATLADLLVVAEGVLVSTDASVDLTAALTAVERALAQDAATPTWTFLLTAQEALETADGIMPSLSVLLTAKESLSLITRLPLGDEDFQAFVINTDTLGVTQYANFPFNSLAEFGNRLYGVTETGLYELTGETDDGAPIAAMLRTGDLTWGDLAELNVPRAYLYFNSDNQAYLKTISTLRGQRTELWYEVSLMAGDEQSRRIKLGRGVRGVRWAFELTNIDGGSLDLREFSVLPVVMRRRRGG